AFLSPPGAPDSSRFPSVRGPPKRCSPRAPPSEIPLARIPARFPTPSTHTPQPPLSESPCFPLRVEPELLWQNAKRRKSLPDARHYHYFLCLSPAPPRPSQSPARRQCTPSPTRTSAPSCAVRSKS